MATITVSEGACATGIATSATERRAVHSTRPLGTSGSEHRPFRILHGSSSQAYVTVAVLSRVYADADDAELVVVARSGDRDAFSFLLERHRPLVLRLCRRLLGSAESAEDAAQEACLQALLSLDRLREPGLWSVARRHRAQRV